MTLGLWILLAIAPSFGASFYLETPPVAEKAVATELAKTAADAGPARIVRRYLEGSGWQYVVVVEGFTDQKVAEAAAKALSKNSGATVDVFSAEGAEAHRVATTGQTAIPPTILPTLPTEPAALPAVVAPASPAASLLFSRAIEQVRPASERVHEAVALVFEFRRNVPGGPVVKHLYASRGADRYLDVVIEQGEGASSRTGLAAGDAWLQQASTLTHEDVPRTKDVVGRFAPELLLATPFGLPALQDRAADATDGGRVDVGGIAASVVQVAGASFAVDAEGHVLRAAWQDASTKIVQEFSDWKDAGGGVVIPHRIRTWRDGTLTDDVEILRLDVKPKVDERWFRVPS